MFGWTKRSADSISRADVLALLDVALAATEAQLAPPKSYWLEFLAWEEQAAAQGSGMTDDQKTGAAMFRSWLVNHAPDDGRPEQRTDR
jgi:hypothetical protein